MFEQVAYTIGMCLCLMAAEFLAAPVINILFSPFFVIASHSSKSIILYVLFRRILVIQVVHKISLWLMAGLAPLMIMYLYCDFFGRPEGLLSAILLLAVSASFFLNNVSSFIFLEGPRLLTDPKNAEKIVAGIQMISEDDDDLTSNEILEDTTTMRNTIVSIFAGSFISFVTWVTLMIFALIELGVFPGRATLGRAFLNAIAITTLGVEKSDITGAAWQWFRLLTQFILFVILATYVSLGSEFVRDGRAQQNSAAADALNSESEEVGTAR